MTGLSNMRGLPLVVVLLIIGALWYVGCDRPQWATGSGTSSIARQPGTTADLISATCRLERPVLPDAGSVVAEFWKTTVGTPITSKRNLLYHAWITASATLLGFAFGTLLASHSPSASCMCAHLDRSLMPWIIASQTIPILAIGPMIIIVLGYIGITA
jgi:NitT/TauT family transport system permease protein